MIRSQVQNSDTGVSKIENDDPTNNGAVFAWGFNSFGELGLGGVQPPPPIIWLYR